MKLGSLSLSLSAQRGGGVALASVAGLDNGNYDVSGDQVTISGLGAPYDGTFTLPPESASPGYIVAPFVTGTPGTGNVLTVNQGIAYAAQGTTLTCTITLKRGGVAFVTDAALSTDHTTDYTYTQLVNDRADGGVTAEVTLDDGTNTYTETLTLVVPTQAAIISSAPVAGVPQGDLLSDGRTWTLYQIDNTGPSALAGNIEFSQLGDLYIALVGGGQGGSLRQFSTNELQFGGTGGNAGEVTDWTLATALSSSEAYSVGEGGDGAPKTTQNTYGANGGDTMFLTLTATGGQQATDGSGTYSPGGSPAGWNAKGGGAGAGGNGEDGQGSFTPAGDGGLPKTISFGSLSLSMGYGGGASSYSRQTSVIGGRGDGSGGGDGQNATASGVGGGTFIPATDGAGPGDGGGGGCDWGNQPLAVAGKGGGGSLLILVEDVA